ncbi:MAG: hypothetical protein LBV03_02415 [Fusobacteriales bacterium]|jgi:hypothetical protein|nr:hypothetical protein [Fusobacteriales bacterium]
MVTRKAIDRLSKELDLPKPDKFSQDWQYEVADLNRLEEFVSFYLKNKLNKNEKFTLMNIILESANDCMQNESLNCKTWKKIEEILTYDREINIKILEYWACEDDEIEDCFYITPLVRKIKEKL